MKIILCIFILLFLAVACERTFESGSLGFNAPSEPPVPIGLKISRLIDGIKLDSLEVRVTGKGDRVRVVPLLPQTAEALKRHMRKVKGGSPYLFPGDTMTGYMEIHNFEKTLRRACIRAGVEPFTPHQLRHFYATEMLRGGAKLEVVARLLGHASVGVTADIYRHVRTEEMHDTVRRFAPACGGLTPPPPSPPAQML